MPTVAPLILGLADLVATEAASAAQATAQALRGAANGARLPDCPTSALAPGLRAALQLAGAHPLCRAIVLAEAALLSVAQGRTVKVSEVA